VSVAEALRFHWLEARVAKLEGLLDELTAILAPEHDATASSERPAATTSSHGMSTSAYFSDRCLQCGGPFDPRRGGKQQRFCTPEHRAAFHADARRWAEAAVTAGLVSVRELQREPVARSSP
jgi:hypothetical protein